MKKIIVCLLIICMVFASMPVSVVSAEATGPIKGEDYVQDDVTYTYLGECTLEEIFISVSDESSWGYQGEGSYWLWNQKTQTLTLHNAAALGLYIVGAEFSGKPVTILLEEQAAILNDSVSLNTAIYCDGDLVITGEGTLSVLQVSTTDESIYSSTISCLDLIISGANITLASLLNENGSIDANNINIINGANVTIASMSSYYTRFLYCDNLLIKDSTVKCSALCSIIDESNYCDGFEVNNNATIENSIVKMDMASEFTDVYGIYVYDGNLVINRGSAIILNMQSIYSYGISAPKIIIDNAYINSNGGVMTSWGSLGYIETSDEFIEYWIITPEISITNDVIITDGAALTYNDCENTYEFDDMVTIMSSDQEAEEFTIAPRTYDDINANDWFASATGFVTARGLFKGVSDTDFDPNGKFTRGQMMMLLARMAGADTTPPEGKPWYEGARLWAIEAGVSDGTNPEDYITREQLVTMLWNFLGKPGEELGELGDIVLLFDDADKIEPWAENAISWAVLNQVVSGKGDNKFDPDGTATRAEASQLMMNFFLNYIEI